MTSTGLVLLPLFCTAIVLAPRPWLLVVLFFAAGFDDGAVANPGGRTIPVSWFFALLTTGRVLWGTLIGQSLLQLEIVRRLFPLAAFVLSCVASLLLAQWLFQGEVSVLPGSARLIADLAAPYRFQPENLNQLVYLFFIVFFVYAVATIAAELGSVEAARWTDRAMRWSCAFVSLVVVWHLANLLSGVWYPAGFFHSAAYSGAWNQGVAGIRRPSGSYMEPSTLSYAFAMYLFYFWQRFRLTSKVGDQLWMLVSLAILVLSTATTGYAVLAAFALLAGGSFALKFSVNMRRFASDAHRPIGNLRLGASGLVSTIVVLLFVSLAVWFLRTNAELVATLYEELILNKGQSESYEVRQHANLMAWSIVFETWGLGIGLGSHRPSSGLLTILVGPGIAGSALFIAFAASVLWRPRIIAVLGPDAARLADPIRWGTFGLLLCHAISAPEIQEVLLWSCFALTIGMTMPPALPAAQGAVPHGSPCRTSAEPLPPGPLMDRGAS